MKQYLHLLLASVYGGKLDEGRVGIRVRVILSLVPVPFC